MFFKKIWQTWRGQKLRPLPIITTPYRAELERVQRQYFLALILLLLAVGYYAYRYVNLKTETEQLVTVIVAGADLTFPHTLELEDLTTIQLPQKWVPIGTWESREQLVGQTLIRSLTANEVLVRADVQPDLNPDSVTAQFAENLAFSVGEDWLVAKLPDLRSGDTVDILATNPGSDLTETTLVASGLMVIAIELGSNRKNLVVNVTFDQAQALLFARGLRLPMQVLTHTAQRGVSISNPSLKND